MIRVKNVRIAEDLWWEETTEPDSPLIALRLVGVDTERWERYKRALADLLPILGISSAQLSERLWRGGKLLPEGYWHKEYAVFWLKREDVVGIEGGETHA